MLFYFVSARYTYRYTYYCSGFNILLYHGILPFLLFGALNDRKQVDSILLDFSKAFDKVCHRKLLLKLKNYGIPAKLLNWIDNFLNDRTQSVVVRGVQSERSIVKSGMPQGTVLGPLLFLVYINDMPERVKSSILALFADDSYLHKGIETVNDAISLQDDLDDLTKWENEWSAEFHPDKCKMLRVTNKRKTINHKYHCLLYTSPSPRDKRQSRMPSSA